MAERRMQWQRTALAALLGAAAGIVCFVLLYGTAVLDVGWDAWVLNGYDEWDVEQHYAGWLLFRNSHWALPLGLADTIAAPDGTVISYTDSIPWVSIGFKLLRGMLPATFQWFGWYVLFCFALQGAAGALLCGRGALAYRGGVLFAALGGAVFVCLPTLWERAFRHTALASHWLYLFALYAYLAYRARAAAGRGGFPWAFAALAFLAVGIHPYFLPLVCLCSLLAMADGIRLAHAWRQSIGQFVLTLAAALAGGYLCGVLGSGIAADRGEYGVWSMNLNAPFNPSSRGGYRWSRVLHELPKMPAQYDGFNYLGLGVLALAAAALAAAVITALRRPRRTAAWWRRNGPLFAVCVFLTLFAASHELYLGGLHVSIPLPAVLVELCGIFRSGGRLFWLVGACIVLFGVYRLRALAPRRTVLACMLLAGVLAVQVWDLSDAAAAKHAMLDGDVPINATVVNHPETQTLGIGHTQLLAVAPVRESRLRLLAILAGKQGMATNLSIAVSGEYPQAAQSMEEAAARLETGDYDPQTVYVTTDGTLYDHWGEIFAGDAAVHLFVADSCYFLVPIPGGV